MATFVQCTEEVMDTDERWEVLIHPTESIESIVLGNCSIKMTPLTTSGALLFEGTINTSRFEGAIQSVAGNCPWLFCSLSVTANDIVSVVPRIQGDATLNTLPGYIKCEFSRAVGDYDSTMDIESLFPQNVHEKMIHADFVSVQDLPICALRVAQFKSHFVVSYRLNHVFYDQSSIVNLMTCLANAYTMNASVSLKKPELKPLESLVPATYPAFPTIEEFDAALPTAYCCNPLDLTFGTSGTTPNLKSSPN